MAIYAIIMFLGAALLAGFGVEIYRGRTELIHDYHQKNVTDKSTYGKSFGRALLVMSLGPLLSGVTALFGTSPPLLIASIALLFTGLIIGTVLLVSTQKKYNKSIF